MTGKEFNVKKNEYLQYIIEHHGQPLIGTYSGEDANLVCDILNEQYSEIKELEKENEQLKETINEVKTDEKQLSIRKELTKIKQGKPTKITLNMMVLSKFDDIPLDILETSIVSCLNVKMNVLGIQFKKIDGDVE